MTSYLVLLNKIAENKFQQREINFIVENSVKIAASYVHHEVKKIRKLILTEDIELEDIAIESISPLFSADSQGMPFRIAEAFRRWNPPINTESEAMFFMNKIIANRVNQHISHMLKNSDPVFSKILDSINYYTKKNGYCKINYLGSVYVSEHEKFDIREKIISYKDFEVFPFYIFNKNKNVLKNIFSYIKNETDFFPAIPLNALILRLKNFYMNEYAAKSQETQFHTKYESVELIKMGLEKASNKLESTYYQKGKLDKREKTAFQNTLNLIAEDLGNGGLNPGLYNYLNIYMKSLTKREYDNKYHHILEYLLKVMKLTIAQNLKN